MPEAKTKTIAIPAPELRNLSVNIQGITPLLCDRYGEETMAAIEERERLPGKSRPKKARDGEAEFRGSLYVIQEANGVPAVYGFPAGGLMKALATAGSRFVSGAHAVVLYGALSIPADLVRITGSEPVMRRDPRGLKGVRSSIIYRSQFTEWSMDVPVIYDAAILDTEQVVNLFAQAGSKVGIGNWRVEKKGIFGQFQVVSATES
jgi:hypothetical protein